VLTVSLTGTGAASSTGANLAAGKTMSASTSLSGFGPALANDANTGTYWESNNNVFPQWLQVDLGSTQSIGQVVLKLPAAWTARTQTLSILGSTDGTTFSTLKASATYPFDPTTNTNTAAITFAGVSTRYVRVNITANSAQPGGQIAELEVYASGIDSTKWYTVINQNSSLCLDASGGGTANGTVVQQWTCGNQQFNQEWQFVVTDSGYFRLLNRNAAAQSEVLDVVGGQGSTGDGVKVDLWAWVSGATNQQWLPVAVGNGYFKLVARNSGKCLDVPGASTSTGVQLQQYTCNGSAAQSFRLAQQP
jgi:hypothetical protein